MNLHKNQEALLSLIRRHDGDLRRMTLRDIAKEIGLADRPQIVAHHLERLQQKGLIRQLAPKSYHYALLADPLPQVTYIPLYRGTAQCGPDGNFGSDDIIDRVPVSTKTFGIAHPSHFFLIKARGKSMEPAINEGDLVLTHRQSDVESGDTAVIVYDGKPMVKKITKLFQNNVRHYFLESVNRSFEPIHVSDADVEFRICGKVKGVIQVH